MTAIAPIDLACCNGSVKLHEWPVRRHEGKGSESKWTKKQKRRSIV